MSAQALEAQIHLPERPEDIAKVLSFLDAHEAAHGTRPAPRYLLVGADEGDSVEIPAGVYRVLRQVVEAMKAGNAVTVAPQSQLLTTQQAADILGVSRPTVVKLIDGGQLPAETPGKRRRMVKLTDLMAYRKQRREQQYRMLVETSADYDELDETPEAMAEEFRRIRAEVADERGKRKA